MWRIDKRILAQFDFISIILILPLIFTSHWLINEVVPALAQKQLAYVGVAVIAGLVVTGSKLLNQSNTELKYWK